MTAVPHCETRGRGEVVLFLHGVGGGHESWAPQLDSFSKGYCAAAWDMPGYGDSVLDAPMTFPMLSDALLALLDSKGWDTVHLVGHSMGGMIALQFAGAHQDRLKSLVLSATSPAFGNPDGDFQKQFVAARLKPLADGGTMADVAQGLVTGFLGDKARPGALDAAIACMERVPAETYKAAVECIVIFEARATLPTISVPTLVVAGERDRNAPAAMMEKMASKIPGADYVCLAGAGHLANMEQPDVFDRAVLDFLQRNKGD